MLKFINLRASFAVAVVALFVFSCSSAQAAEWATLTGRIVVDGKPPKEETIPVTKDAEVCGKHKLVDEGLIVDSTGGLANAVIMLKTKLKPDQIAPSAEEHATDKVVLDNKNCRFEPHVAVVRTTQTLELKNSDPVAHNTKVDPLQNQAINPILPVGQTIDAKFPVEEGFPVKVGCNIHPWMGAYLVVRKDPYAAVTDSKGNFTIKDLPAGVELEFLLWGENPGYLKNATFKGGKATDKGRFKIKLKPGENDLGDIKFNASIFKK